MTAIMEHRVPIFILCVIFLTSFNVSYAMIMTADIDYNADAVIFTSGEAYTEFKKVRAEAYDWWDTVLEPIIESPPYKTGSDYITRTEAFDIFEAKWGFRYQDPMNIQQSSYFKNIGGAIGDQLFVKRSEFDEDLIKQLEGQGMPPILSFIFLIVNIVIGIVLAILVWSFVYDGLSLIPFVGR